MNRRKFLQAAAAAVAATELSGGMSGFAFAADRAGANATPPSGGEMIYRTLGRTGEKVSAIGVGGYHIGIQKDEAESIRIIRTAVDRGINFLDNCWDYNGGASETRMGKALRDGYRDRVFLMTKIDGRTKAAAMKQLDESLKRLQTDRVDLIQHHEIIRLEDPDRVFNDGAQDAMLDAKKAGKVRYIGFTGHKDPQVHLRMLETAKKHGQRFDTVQMPLNVLDAHFRSFGQTVLPVLVKEEIGVLGMKPLASGAVMQTNTVTAIEALHYAMSLPTSVVINGMDSMARLDQAMEAIRTFKPLTQEQVAALLQKTAKVAAEGRHERFKTTAQFDGTASHPDWLG